MEDEAKGGTPVVHASWILLRAGIDNYIALRNQTLKDAIAHLKPDSSATASSQQDKWVAHFKQKWGEAYPQIENLGRGAERAIEDFVRILAAHCHAPGKWKFLAKR